MFLQINETELSLESAPPPFPWMTSPRSVRHPATHTAVSRYSVRHLQTEVIELAKIWRETGALNLCAFHCRSFPIFAPTTKVSRPTSLETSSTSTTLEMLSSERKRVSQFMSTTISTCNFGWGIPMGIIFSTYFRVVQNNLSLYV